MGTETLAAASLSRTEPARPPEAVCKLPSFPPVAARLVQMLSRDDTQISQVVALIRSDPAFSAEILQLANSPLYACPSRVGSLTDAVALIGLEQAKALALTVAMQTSLNAALKHSSMRQCWRHALATAVIAQRLAPRFAASPDAAYTAAIVHDLGRRGLLAAYGKRYEELLARPYHSPAEVLEAERAAFEVDHCEAGAWLARSWGFPAKLWSAVHTHHLPPSWPGERIHNVTRAACRLATLSGFSSPQYSGSASAEELPFFLSLLETPALEDGLDELKTAVSLRIASIDLF